MNSLNRTLEGRHPGTAQVGQWFEYGHLPDGGPRQMSAECAELAEWVIETLPDSSELTVGLRKLLEAKDCFVRAAIAAARTKHDASEVPDSTRDALDAQTLHDSPGSDLADA